MGRHELLAEYECVKFNFFHSTLNQRTEFYRQSDNMRVGYKVDHSSPTCCGV